MASTLGYGGTTPFAVISTPIAYRHSIFIKNALEHPEEMISAINILSLCSENDVVELHINSPGGLLDSMDSLRMAISKCPATIHVVATGTIASAVTFFMFNCDSFEISDDATFLFHSMSYGSFGEMQDVKEFVDFTHDRTCNFLKKNYLGFLTQDEIDDMIKNKRQIYMDAQEFSERYSKYLEFKGVNHEIK